MAKESEMPSNDLICAGERCCINPTSWVVLLGAICCVCDKTTSDDGDMSSDLAGDSINTIVMITTMCHNVEYIFR